MDLELRACGLGCMGCTIRSQECQVVFEPVVYRVSAKTVFGPLNPKP